MHPCPTETGRHSHISWLSTFVSLQRASLSTASDQAAEYISYTFSDSRYDHNEKSGTDLYVHPVHILCLSFLFLPRRWHSGIC